MTEKKPKREKKPTIEEIYKNLNFVPPKEKNLETIFEEPRKAKDGAPVLTSVRKYKRFLHFDSTEGKIHKRKLKAKKCINKLKSNKLRTRSCTKTIQCEDISLYISEQMGGNSDSEMEECDTPAATKNIIFTDSCKDECNSSEHISLNENKVDVSSLTIKMETKDDNVRSDQLEFFCDSVVPQISAESFSSFSGETKVISKDEESSPKRSSCVVA